MGKDPTKTKLPPERYFQLSHIITYSKTIQQDLQNLNDSFVNTINLYNKDVSEQLVESINVENELIGQLGRVRKAYDVVHKIRTEDTTDTQINEHTNNDEDETTNNKTNKHSKPKNISISMFGITNNKNEQSNKFETLNNIDLNMEYLLNETIIQKKRLDTMISRLKKVELNLPKRERLFNEKSVNKNHYLKLYQYGMKTSKKTVADETPEPIEIIKPESMVTKPIDTKPKRQPRKSNSSSISKVSQRKLNQYLYIENELDSIKNAKSVESVISDPTTNTNKGFNPISLVSSKTDSIAPCKVSDELITIRSDINTLRKDQMRNDNATSLVAELKKLYEKS